MKLSREARRQTKELFELAKRNTQRQPLLCVFTQRKLYRI